MYSGLSKEFSFDLENSKNKSGSNILVEFSYDLYLLYMVYLSLYLKGFLCYDLHNKCMTLRFKINQSKSYWTFFTYINLFPMVPFFLMFISTQITAKHLFNILRSLSLSTFEQFTMKPILIPVCLIKHI